MATEGVGSRLRIGRTLPVLYLLETLGLEVEHSAAFYTDSLSLVQTITDTRCTSGRSKRILVRVQVTGENDSPLSSTLVTQVTYKLGLKVLRPR